MKNCTNCNGKGEFPVTPAMMANYEDCITPRTCPKCNGLGLDGTPVAIKHCGEYQTETTDAIDLALEKATTMDKDEWQSRARWLLSHTLYWYETIGMEEPTGSLAVELLGMLSAASPEMTKEVIEWYQWSELEKKRWEAKGWL